MPERAYTFQADTDSLRKQADKRRTSMQAVRNAHEELWKDIRDNFEPDIGIALDSAGQRSDESARRRDGKILNSEPRTLLHRLAAGLQSGITNQSQRWFSLIAMDKDAAQRASVKRWLSRATETISDAMARGNLYTTLDRIYLHMGAFGTACAVAVNGDAPGDVHFEFVDTGDYWLAENRRGRVDTLIRRIHMTASKIVEEFGHGWTPEQIREQADGTAGETEHEVYNLICPNDGRPEFRDIPKDRAFVSVYWTGNANAQNNGILAVRGFRVNPIVAPRWSVNGSVYGHGPGKVGLGDARQLQTMERDKLRIIAEDGTPTLLAASRLRGQRAIDNYPGCVVFDEDDPDGSAAPARRLFETRQGIQGVLEGISDTTRRLQRIFYADLFAMMLNATARQQVDYTARQVNELSAEKVALLGPILTRMNTDMLNPIVSIYFDALTAAGAFPPPPEEFRALPVGVAYASALHVEQISSTKMRGLIKVLDVVGMVAKLKPSALDKFDADQTIDEVLASTPDSAAVILDDNEVAEIRRQRAEAQAAENRAQALAAAAPGVGRAVKDLSQAQTGNGSALDQIIAQAGGPQA